MTLRDFEAWPSGPLHLAIGVFDGVHLGHQALVRRLCEGARAAGATALAASFDPLPIQVLAPGAPASALSDAQERAARLRAAGADEVVLFTFDAAFSSLPADDFIARLRAAGDVRRIVVGEDFQFGRGREGDVRTLEAAGGFTVDVVAPVVHAGEVVSSTRVRNALLRGDVEEAATLLGRPYGVAGRVLHGDRRGRALGYPTVNVAPAPERILPRDGIYATWVEIAGARRAAAASLGVRPTFGGGERRLEAFILDFADDAYGEHARVEFVRRLRDELRFESPEALVAQIALDVEATRAALRGGERG